MLIASGMPKSRALRADLPALGTPDCDQADLESLRSCCQTTVHDLALTKPVVLVADSDAKGQLII